MKFSRTLNTADGGWAEQAEELRQQLRLVQEETEDMIRILTKKMEQVSAAVEALQARGI